MNTDVEKFGKEVIDNQRKQGMRLTPITDGTVLDHLPAKSALKILRVLGLKYEGAVTVAINTESTRAGRKDLIFISNKELSERDVEKVGLIAENATWNLIKGGKVISKNKIPYPHKAKGTIICQNPKCVTNNEPIPTKFNLEKETHTAQCYYCNSELSGIEIIKAIGKK